MALGRALLGVMVAFAVALAAVTVWGNVHRATAGPGASGSSAEAEAPSAPPARITTTPAAGATGVAPAQPAAVHVADGRLTDIALVGPDGAAVPGRPLPDGWTSTATLAFGATYTWKGLVLDGNGAAQPLTGSFTTVTPQQKIGANLNIGDGATVGIAAPIIVQFDGTVTDKAAAQRALSVQTSVPTTGSWAWLPDTEQGSRAHWRPENYWKPGTQVSVAANLQGVDVGGGTWGTENVTSHFTIGRAQIVKADVNSFHMLVVDGNGKTLQDVPASYGLGADPNRNTTNGVHVVMSKQQTVLMSNPAYGYNNVPEHWAVRISNNGEFIHANPLSEGAQGNENVTHGCVNLSTQDAENYFNTAIFGDPVEVTGSPVPMPRTDIYDWSLTWQEWQSLSALPV
ncbi:Ig-like domain-containing protein [Actinomycetospora sp. TBRC 11914]|uniref:L,D-transpeptidase n=1 Tax=Actinomycetospora sp. TBRC 11914 TaxID=2729387 RepID=UPI00145CD94D|nr:Ig-like domain-containing protein [Actinomycetospora sp. TBRC 11914]NMO91048.1 L,D-transpeptidase family protein [Actinomycetospora sp. TBRC 11914]